MLWGIWLDRRVKSIFYIKYERAAGLFVGLSEADQSKLPACFLIIPPLRCVVINLISTLVLFHGLKYRWKEFIIRFFYSVNRAFEGTAGGVHG